MSTLDVAYTGDHYMSIVDLASPQQCAIPCEPHASQLPSDLARSFRASQASLNGIPGDQCDASRAELHPY